ncbi:MAG: hypothetical protein M0Z40_06055, partial [Actinomycetota bacterium]|nr:hypothetical protein [Actinomycetota bacterium]
MEVRRERFATSQEGSDELTAFLMDAAVATVAMEPTGVYCQTVHYAFESLSCKLQLCNTQHAKNVPAHRGPVRRRVVGRRGRSLHGAAPLRAP